MFDVGLMEMLVIGVVALIVLGPGVCQRRRATRFLRAQSGQSWHSVRAEFERELATEELKRSVKASELTQSCRKPNRLCRRAFRTCVMNSNKVKRHCAQRHKPNPCWNPCRWRPILNGTACAAMPDGRLGARPVRPNWLAQPVEALLPEIVVASNVDAPQTTPSIQG